MKKNYELKGANEFFETKKDAIERLNAMQYIWERNGAKVRRPTPGKFIAKTEIMGSSEFKTTEYTVTKL